MPRYIYEVRDDQGRVVEGEVEAPSVESAKARLARAFEVVISLERARGRRLATGWDAPLPPEVLSTFIRQFLTMLEVGIPSQRAAYFLAEGETNRRLRSILRLMTRKLESGWAISRALREHPNAFPPLLVNLVETGEETGRLVETLATVADFLDRWITVRKRITATLAYPVVLTGTAAFVVALIGLFLVPRMIRILALAGDTLPLPTRMLLWLAGTVQRPLIWLEVALVLGLLVHVGWRLLPRIPSFRYELDRLMLRLPVVGGFVERVCVARMLRALVMILRSGPGASRHLEIVEKVAGNLVLAGRFREARLDMLGGRSMAEVLEEHEAFPNAAICMVRVGEESGTLISMLARTASLYEEEVEASLQRVQILLEPLTLALMGLVVGFLALALGLPTINLLYRVAG